jgi:hypothetical protein
VNCVAHIAPFLGNKQLYKSDEGMNPAQGFFGNRNAQNNPNHEQSVRVSKRDLKSRISSRQDFVLLFGFERSLKSRVLFAPEKIHLMAFYHPSLRRPKEVTKTQRYSPEHHPPQNKGSDSEAHLEYAERRQRIIAIFSGPMLGK